MRRTTVQYICFLLFLLLVTLAFVWLIQDFLLPLFWAATLAIVFYPVCRWLQSRLGTRASVAALLTLGVILVASSCRSACSAWPWYRRPPRCINALRRVIS